MSQFIKLSTSKPQPMDTYINMDLVVEVSPTKPSGSWLRFLGDEDVLIWVKESPDQIMKILCGKPRK